MRLSPPGQAQRACRRPGRPQAVRDRHRGGSGSRRDYGTVAYTARDGRQLWLQQYNGPANLSDFASDIAVSPDGSKLFVTGHSGGSGTGQDFSTVAYDAAMGAQLWVQRYEPGFDDAALAVSPDGSRPYVTGPSRSSGGGYDYATLAYDAATGTELWLHQFDGPAGNSDDVATDLGVGPDGSELFVTGKSKAKGESFYDYTTLAYSTG